MKQALITSVLLIFFGSCTIEKRLYTKGLHIEFRGAKINSSKSDTSPVNTENNTITLDADSILKNDVCKEAGDEEVALKNSNGSVDSSHLTRLVPRTKNVKTNQKDKNVVTSEAVYIHKQTKLVNRNIENFKNNSLILRQKQFNDDDVLNYILIIIVGIIVLLCLAFPTLGAIVEGILGIAISVLFVIGVVYLVVWLCNLSGNFPWFWSGR